MAEGSIAERVRAVVARQLKVDLDRVTDGAQFVADLGADSLQSMELIAAFEDEFDIEMDEDEAVKVKTVGAAIDFIARVVAEQHGK
jgi:acyl carrier protein